MTVTSLVAAQDVLDRANALLALDGPPTPESVRADVRRQAWAMGVASIDTYLHWAVHRVDLNQPLPRALRNLDVKFTDLVAMAHEGLGARKEGRLDRPLVRARNVMHQRILQETYQSSRGIETALQMIGVQDCWGKLSIELAESKQHIKDHVDALARRRNSVVHEGDIERQSKPRQIKHQPLDQNDVRAELDWIREFVDALGRIAR